MTPAHSAAISARPASLAFGVVMVFLPVEVGDPSDGASRNPPLLWLPLPCQLLGLGYLGRGHPLGNDVAVVDRLIAVLAGGGI